MIAEAMDEAPVINTVSPKRERRLVALFPVFSEHLQHGCLARSFSTARVVRDVG